MRGPFLVVLAFLGLGALMNSAHRHTDAWAPPEAAQDEIRYLPSGRSLRAASLGFEPMVADLLWVKAVLLFGERYASGDDSWYPWLFHMTDLATDLEPQFKAAYKMGGTMLRTDGVFSEQSSLIFQKGMLAMPNEWYFPFAVGMNYHMTQNQPAIAARYVRRAAETGRGPLYLRNLAASLLSDSNQMEVAERFLLEELKALPPGTARNVATAKVYEIRYEIAMREANKTIAAYREQEGRLPSQPSDISEAGFTLPPDPMRDTSLLVALGVSPSVDSRWIWDPHPEAAIGTVASSGFPTVFRAIALSTGFGGAGVDRSGH
jgi:hypothetical protein